MSRPWIALLTVAAVAVAAAPAARAQPRLVVGSPYSSEGPRQEGLFQGDRTLSLDEFLAIAGHQERIDQIAARRKLKLGLMIGGGAVVAGGFAYAYLVESCDPNVSGPAGTQCSSRHGEAKTTGLVIGLAGAVAATTGFLISSKRPSTGELREIAAEHNRSLRVEPIAIGDRGGGLLVSGRF